MNKIILASIVGEQPQPAYFVQKCLRLSRKEIDKSILFATERSKDVAERIEKLLKAEGICVDLVPGCEAYDTVKTRELMQSTLAAANATSIWDVTGATKPMLMAALSLGMPSGSEMVYLERNQIRRYRFEHAIPVGLEAVKLPELININQYLNLQGIRFDSLRKGSGLTEPSGRQYEADLLNGLQQTPDLECHAGGRLGDLEIDFILRRGNEFAIVEAKKKSKPKRGMDQLNTASQPRRFGTFVKKLLVRSEPLGASGENLARFSDIHFIQVPCAGDGTVSASDQIQFATAVHHWMK